MRSSALRRSRSGVRARGPGLLSRVLQPRGVPPPRRRLLPNSDYRVLTNDDVRGIRNSGAFSSARRRQTRSRGHGSRRPRGHREDPAPPERLQRTGRPRRGCPDQHRRRRHAHDGQLPLQWQSASRRTFGAAIVHLRKTIDNDYHGIDFTFGFFTAVDVMAREVQNLRRCPGHQLVVHRRDHGAEGGLGLLRRGHRRRGTPRPRF